MNEIFNTGDGRKLAIYENHNSLFMCAFGRDFASRPTLLSNDYSKDLSACILGNKLYYAYIALNNHIKVKSIDEVRTKWEFDETANNLFLTTFNGVLALFYTKEESRMMKTTSTTTEINSDSENDNASILQSETSSGNREKLHIHSHILIGEAAMSNAALLMHIYENTLMPRAYTDYCVNNHIEHQLNETLLQTKKDYLFSITSELEEKYAQKDKERKKHFDELLVEKEGIAQKLAKEEFAKKEHELKLNCQEQINVKENSIRRNYENKIKELNATISSIKLQYEQLMNTASRYREEAAKWHSMYHAKSRKNQNNT